MKFSRLKSGYADTCHLLLNLEPFSREFSTARSCNRKTQESPISSADFHRRPSSAATTTSFRHSGLLLRLRPFFLLLVFVKCWKKFYICLFLFILNKIQLLLCVWFYVNASSQSFFFAPVNGSCTVFPHFSVLLLRLSTSTKSSMLIRIFFIDDVYLLGSCWGFIEFAKPCGSEFCWWSFGVVAILWVSL